VAYEQRVQLLTDLADGKPITLRTATSSKNSKGERTVTSKKRVFTPGVNDRLAAMEQLARYGIGTTKEVSIEEVKAKVEAMLNVLKQELEPPAIRTAVARTEAGIPHRLKNGVQVHCPIDGRRLGNVPYQVLWTGSVERIPEDLEDVAGLTYLPCEGCRKAKRPQWQRYEIVPPDPIVQITVRP
jgi:hypothetical protein